MVKGATSECCLDDSRQFDLSDHNPNAKNTTGAAGGGNEGMQNGKDASGGSGGKSSRVTIGAAVGGAVGGLAIIGGVFCVWLYLRKKRAKQEKKAIAQSEALSPPEMKQALEAGAGSMTGRKDTSEADMKDHASVVEMDSAVVYELGD
ncbi:uncharacterized protein TrAtP1_000212 [Trichoderma atroviride]|uniref:uncharacterized protein n=1 Tax=Hypocrea atroviridis TaxID=63577 RepID=UPI0033175352|nr:hypothetical protein TrAtP1_000212 [Trichoderma atroviride]